MTNSSDGSLSAGSPVVRSRSFRLNNASEVLLLLRDVHRSTLMSDVKNRVRDEIFLHQQNGIELSDQVIKDLASIGISIGEGSLEENSTPEPATEAASESAQPAATPKVSSAQPANFRRPSPQFVAARSTPVQPITQINTPPVASAPTEDVAPQSTPIANTSVASVESPVKKEPAVLDKSDHIEPVIENPAPVPSPQAAPVGGSGDTVIESAQTTIATIKREVNEMVGNPVNLIDADNAVGREYMNALLDAMKRVNSGAADAEIERSITRLENAFETVKQIVNKPKSTPNKPTTTPSVSESKPTPETVADTSPNHVDDPAPQSENSSFDPAEPKAAPEPDVAPIIPAAAEPEPAEPLQSAASTVPIRNVSEPVPPAPPAPPTAPVTPPTPPTPATPAPSPADVPPVPVSSVPPVPTPAAPLSINEDGNVEAPVPPAPEPVQPATLIAPEESEPAPPTPPKAPDTAPQASTAGLRPVSKDKQIKDLMADQDAKYAAAQAEKMAENAKDPLYAENVTNGLKQLLSEWKLFKSSGLFGTGPSGIEHPLYKEISHLTMAAVLAGRYESANADVKQSITDYMNGWRYEEGIVHEHGETFEHYLRRVIRHILDRTAAA